MADNPVPLQEQVDQLGKRIAAQAGLLDSLLTSLEQMAQALNQHLAEGVRARRPQMPAALREALVEAGGLIPFPEAGERLKEREE